MSLTLKQTKASRCARGETGVPIEEVAVIGDGCNDIAMFAQCPFSIAMGNASEEVKAKARSNGICCRAIRRAHEGAAGYRLSDRSKIW
jgi:hydroxymethylpyrimidine pyrophosphatase-like HAD family hydrolase